MNAGASFRCPFCRAAFALADPTWAFAFTAMQIHMHACQEAPALSASENRNLACIGADEVMTRLAITRRPQPDDRRPKLRVSVPLLD